MVQIVDATGSGNSAKVNNENMIFTNSIVSSIEHFVNHSHGNAYNVLFSQSPTANDDCIFYMKNTSNDDMVLEGVTISVDSACQVYIKLGDIGTRNSPVTNIIPANLNVGSGKTALGDFEKGADLDGGAATLNGGIEVERFVFIAATSSSHNNFEQDLIVPKNRMLTIWCSSSSATVTATLPFNYHTTELA